MERKYLEKIIKSKINFIELDDFHCDSYDALDMTGFNDFKNFHLISKFDNYFFHDVTDQNCNLIIPRFHKGMCRFIKLRCDGYSEIVLDDLGGWSTCDILFKMIELNNPKIFDIEKNG